jgi:hypothetical protein
MVDQLRVGYGLTTKRGRELLVLTKWPPMKPPAPVTTTRSFFDIPGLSNERGFSETDSY